MQKQAQQIAEDYSDWMKYLPDNVHLSQVSMPGSHDACTMYGSHYEYQERHARRKVSFQMAAKRRIRLHERNQDHQGAGTFDRGTAGGRCPHVRPASVGVGQLAAGPSDSSRHRRAGRPDPRPATRRAVPGGRSCPALHALAPARPLRELPERASRRDGADTHEIREHQRHRKNGLGQERRRPDKVALQRTHRRFPSPDDAGPTPAARSCS